MNELFYLAAALHPLFSESEVNLLKLGKMYAETCSLHTTHSWQCCFPQLLVPCCQRARCWCRNGAHRSDPPG